MRWHTIIVLSGLSVASSVWANETRIGLDHPCWARAASVHGLAILELQAHACVESSLQIAVENRTHFERTGSTDIGLMQINSRHLRTLAKEGVTREVLLTDACTNIDIGARILAEKKRRLGDSWNATGAYNAGCSSLKGEACTAARSRYAWKVYRAMRNLVERGRC